MSPPDAPIDDPTFLITLWPQALIAPLSLGDPRTTCLLHGRDGMRSMILINFEAAAAFWPNDWFLADVESWNGPRLFSLLCRVRLDQKPEEWRRPLQAIVYDDFTTVD